MVEHRWQYLYEVLDWVLPRKSALQYLKLNDILEGSTRDDVGGDGEKHQLSSRHLELLATLVEHNEKSCRFWALAGLANVLASWMHQVTRFLHGCPCHPNFKDDSEKQPKKRRKLDLDCFFEHNADEEASCPMLGRMAVPLASGFVKHSLQALSCAQIPAHTQEAIDDLNRMEGLEGSSGTMLLSHFEAARSRITFRMKQNFGYWTQLPWALLMVMRPFVLTFASPDEA